MYERIKIFDSHYIRVLITNKLEVGACTSGLEHNGKLIMSTLHCSIRCKHTAYLSMLLTADNELAGAKEKGSWTATMRACQYNNYDALTLLLTVHKANADEQLENGWTALMICARYGHGKCAQLLIDVGKGECECEIKQTMDGANDRV